MNDDSMRLLSAKEVGMLLGRNRTTIIRWAKQGKMPAPLVDDHGKKSWSIFQIRAWMCANVPQSVHIVTTEFTK